MKRLLFFIPLLMLATACAKAPKEELEPLPPGTNFTSVLTADKTTLTTSDTTEPMRVTIASDSKATVSYEVELSANIYLNTKSSVANQICLKPGASIKSISDNVMYRLVIDFYGGKGVNFQVFGTADASGEAIEPHESSISPIDPTDGGQVLEYPLLGYQEWCIKNNTEFNKPSFYSISIIYG